VTTSSLASSTNIDYYDSMSAWHKMSPGSITGLDLSDPRQLAELSRFAFLFAIIIEVVSSLLHI